MKALKINPGVLAAIRGKSKGERYAIGLALQQAQQHFGDPHSHRGLGIRKISAKYYEIRVGLDYRLVFTNAPAHLRLVAEGSHDDIKRFLKQNS